MSSLIEDDNINVMTGRPVRKPKLIEAYTEMLDPSSQCTLRVWRKVDEVPTDNDFDVLLCLNKLPGGISLASMFDVLGSLPGVTKIHMTDASGQGVMVHYE